RCSGHWNTPTERGPADRQIAQAAAHEADDFVPARRRRDKFWVLFVELQQAILPRGQAEEVGRLAHPRHRRSTWRDLAAVRSGGQLVLVVKCFIANGIPAFVMTEIDIAGFLDTPPKLGAGVLVTLLGRAYPIIIR